MASKENPAPGNDHRRNVFNADIIIEGAMVVTMDAGFRVIENGGLAIKDGLIAGIGESHEITTNFHAPEVIDGQKKLLMPGLINTHTHTPMTIFRGFADDLPLHEWLYDHVFPVESEFTSAENVRIGAKLGIAEMLRSGTTTFNDMYYYVDEVAAVAEKAGIRSVLNESVIDFPAPGSPTPDDGLSLAESLISKWKGHPLVTIGVAAHAPYSTSPATLKKAKALADNYRVPFNIHVSETRREFDSIMKEYGASPVQHLENIGVLGPNVIAAHCVHITKEDIHILADKGVGVAHNPQCNMKLASGVAPVPELLRAGVKVGIGTDGVASNNDLDLFEEMRTAAFVHKLNSNDPTVMDARTVLEAGTMGGARLLGMEHQIGSLETGKKADLIILDLDQPHAHPLYNIYSLIIYSLKGSDVDTVIIEGKPVMRQRKMLTMNEEKLFEKVEAIAREIAGKSPSLLTLNLKRL